MQRRARSGELDVFGATRYFAGPVAARREKKGHRGTLQQELEAQARPNKSNLAAAFFVSPAVSFRKKNLQPAASSSTSASRGSNSICSDVVVPTADHAFAGAGVHDLGVVVGDRRLRGVRVVNGDVEERWVVRCGGAWEEEEERRLFLHDCKIFEDDAAASSSSSDCHQVGGGHDRGSDTTDSSSDLFELDFGRC